MTDEATPKPKKKKKKRGDAAAPRKTAKRAAEASKHEGPLAYTEAKRWAAGAAVLLLVGIGLVAIGDASLGPYLTVLGMATAIWGAHRLGRSGPDELPSRAD